MTSDELRRFFEAYGASFQQSAESVADFYNVPCLTARAATVRLNSSRQEVVAFFDNVLTAYRSKGNTHGDILTLSSVTQGANAISATVRWAYKNASGVTQWEWTFTYTLYKGSCGWKILVQTMHDEP